MLHFLVFPLALLVASSAFAQRPSPIQDEGPLNAFHREHAGQIVFSRTPIARTAIPRDPVTTFRAGENIYLRVYQAASAENLYRRMGQQCDDTFTGTNSRDRWLHARVGQGQWIMIEFDVISNELWQTTTSYTTSEDDEPVALYDGRPLAAHDDTSSEPRYNFANRLLPLLQPGDNAVEFQVMYRCNMTNEFPAASSTVNIRVDGDRSTAALRFERNRLPENLQRHMVRAVSRYAPSRFAAVRAIATTAWSVAYHPINGHPVSRTADGYLFLRDERNDTCAYMAVSYTQRARTRSAFHDEMEGSAALGDPSPLACASIPRR